MQRLEKVTNCDLSLSRNQQSGNFGTRASETSAKRGEERNEKKPPTFFFTLASSCSIALRFDPVFGD
jgi:hypothetical protein